MLSRGACRILLKRTLMERLGLLTPNGDMLGIVRSPDCYAWRSLRLAYVMRHLCRAARREVRLERMNLPSGPCLPRKP